MQQSPRTQEAERASPSGYLWVAIGIALVAAGILLVVRPMGLPFLALGVVLIVLGAFTLAGLYMLQPNEAAILLLFGEYVGTDRSEGLRWANPFFKKQKISLRAHNLMSERLKVNDSEGKRTLILDLPGVSASLAASVGVEMKCPATRRKLLSLW